MAYSVDVTAEAERDVDLIFDFLVESHLGFGDSLEAALDRAAARTRSIRADARRLGLAPFRGTIDDTLSPGLRHVTINRAVFYFEVKEDKAKVRILGIFFGGQDHQRRMLTRLLGDR